MFLFLAAYGVHFPQSMATSSLTSDHHTTVVPQDLKTYLDLKDHILLRTSRCSLIQYSYLCLPVLL